MGAMPTWSRGRLLAGLLVIAVTVAMATALPQQAHAVTVHHVNDPQGALSGETVDISKVVYVKRFETYIYGVNCHVESHGSGVTVLDRSQGRGGVDNHAMLGVSGWASGSQGAFKVRYDDIGYTARDGRHVDMILEGTAKSGDGSSVGFYDLEGLELMSWASENGQFMAEEVEIQAKITFVYAGTNNRIPNDSVVGYAFTDIDVPATWDDDDRDSAYSGTYAESVELIDGYDQDIYIGNSNYSASHHVPSDDGGWDWSTQRELRVETINGHPWIRSSHVCHGEDASLGEYYGQSGIFADSTVAFLGTNDFDFRWRGYQCGTVLGVFVNFTKPPGFTPTKSVTEPVVRPEDTETMYVCADLKHVSETNKFRSITFSDGLHAAFDASTATLKVQKKNDSGNWVDVTSNWNITDHTQMLKATAKNTSEGYATGEHRFVITAKLKSAPAYDYLGNLSLGTYNGRSYLTFANTASVIAVGQDNSQKGGSSNTVNMFVPYIDYNPTVQKTGSHLVSPIQAGQFTFDWKPLSGVGIAQTKTNGAPNAQGVATVSFDTIRFIQAGSYSYQVSEREGNDPRITYDSHKCMVVAIVSWDDSTKTYSLRESAGSSKTFTNVGPPPAPTKSVDKETAEVDGYITYTVNQKAYAGWTYKSLVFVDPIPTGTEYVPGSLVVTQSEGGNCTASAGTVVLNGSTLSYTFNPSWLESNRDQAVDLTFTFRAKVLDAAAGGNVANQATTNANNAWLQYTNKVTTKVPVWYVKAQKASDWPDLLDGNPTYSLAGAEFKVTDARNVRSGMLRTVVDGSTNTVKVVHSGVCEVEEVTAPAGHAFSDPRVKETNLTVANSGQTFTLDFTDPAIYLDMSVIASKLDWDYYIFGLTEQDRRHAQGNSPSFLGCVVRVDFYAGGRPTGIKLASAEFAADADGFINLSTATPVNGTTWRYVRDGRNALPLGCVTVTEVAAPVGYSVDDTVHVATVVQDGYDAVLVPGANWTTVE